MNRFYTLLTGVIFSTSIVTAQSVQLSPQVIASQGGNFKGTNFEISYTIGELAAVTTITNQGENLALTQGFHQPDKYSIVDTTSIEFVQALWSAQLYPNPATELINLQISFDKNTRYLVDVFDASGRKVIDSQVLNHMPGLRTYQFNTSSLASGTYLMRLRVEGSDRERSLRFTRML